MTASVLRNRYELGEVLGGGSGSTTYLARDRETGDLCVVKALSVGETVRRAASTQTHSYDSDDFTKLIELFEREARVLSHMDHPSVPRLIDHFTEEARGDTWLYTVQEHVPGKTLQQLVEQGRHFTEAEAVDIGRQVAEVLAYLHDRSPPLIHRDIKPTNVIVDEDGSVHLVDFGSVRNAMGGDDLDGRTIVGTYGYMPIEQYEARAVPQSDFYALGMTLIFALSHREPTRIPRLGLKLEFRPLVNVSERFASVLDRMIEPAPEDRFASAAELLAALKGKGKAKRKGKRKSVARGGQALSREEAAIVASAQEMQSWMTRVFVVAAGAFVVLGSSFFITFFVFARSDAPSSPAGVAPSGATRVREPTPEPLREAVRPVGDAITLDIDRDFLYQDEGFPMRRAARQSSLPLARAPAEALIVPPGWAAPSADLYYGFFPMGNGGDTRIGFSLRNDGGHWSILVDTDNDEDLTDEGEPRTNEGSGPLLAVRVEVQVEVVDDAGQARARRYGLWTWFNESSGGSLFGRYYARNHYIGTIETGAGRYRVTAYEQQGHDALYRDAGVCIDLDRDNRCNEDTELFEHGATVRFPDGAAYRLVLAYP